ncbi:MAG: ATP-dependent Clp protease proteolytic subunit, partial [Phycisphaerales bacterium]
MQDHLTPTAFPNPFAGIDPSKMAGLQGAMDPRNPIASVNYQRTREMSIDELLLENRVVFLIGEINQASAARVMMQMLYLENQK